MDARQGKSSMIRRSNSMSSSSHRRRTRSIDSSQFQADEVPLDEDAARWAEVIRQRRLSKRKKVEDEDAVMVGTRVSEGHTNWVTAYNMLTGIRVATSRCNAKVDRELTDMDFAARHKLTFDLAGNELTPSARYDFKFKDYAPWVFRHLRAEFCIDPADYLMSLTGKYILSELGSPGKSGSFFYFSRDYRFIIKTLHHAEHKFLRRILRQYYDHVKKYPNTMISQFYGLHRVKTSFGKKIHFVVMNNLFPPHMDIHATYDLKGSTVGRIFSEESKKKNPRGTLKDLNWLGNDERLKLPSAKRPAFVEQLEADVKLLAQLGIMDYSLLLGIHRMKEAAAFSPPTSPLALQNDSSNGAPLVRTPSVSGQAYRRRDLRRMVTPQGSPITLGQLNAHGPPGPHTRTNNVAGIDRQLQAPPLTAIASESDIGIVHSEGMRHNLFYQFEGGIRSENCDGTPGDVVYYLGIIDLLTRYGTRKHLEHFFKGLGKPAEYKKQISAVPPQDYAKRFRDFISAMTKKPNEIKEGRLKRTPSAVALDSAMRELEREHADEHSQAAGPVMSPVLQRNPDIILPVLEEGAPQSPTTQAGPKSPTSSKRRSQELAAPGARNSNDDDETQKELYLNDKPKVVGNSPSVRTEADVSGGTDSHDSGLASSLDCLPEVPEEPSRESSIKRPTKEALRILTPASPPTALELAPALERDPRLSTETLTNGKTLLATYELNDSNVVQQPTPPRTQATSPALSSKRVSNKSPIKAARRQGMLMEKADIAYEDEGFEDGAVMSPRPTKTILST
ncbi:hypothetical protein BCR37DRAFT_392344 [Protomyces lactucae-debilis]|uniref:1-phosphatidylinositol-4-phosphate 5-kinase n=1 Tax=Protomyces lactucae-debilis TaxID=2754530 RepID=A0A1Y2FM94_PROLT|nr:uncharacterized protein BCR37DRAFT_392344 [Protomyces lactucae-debilis]ORY83895.1 hypothetical protein BCR37DRAFT_392344 [Protomyces lactucae-debilis]